MVAIKSEFIGQVRSLIHVCTVHQCTCSIKIGQTCLQIDNFTLYTVLYMQAMYRVKNKMAAKGEGVDTDTGEFAEKSDCFGCGSESSELKSLTCLHSFCKKCLESMIQKHGSVSRQDLRCPVCERKTEYTEGFFDDFTNASQETGEEKTYDCHVCQMSDKKTVATHMCMQCDDYLCSGCSEWHCHTKMTRYHEIVTLDSVKEKQPHHNQLHNVNDSQKDRELESTICVEHDKIVDLFCRKCVATICSECQSIKHSDHETVSLQEELEATRIPNIEGLLAELQAKLAASEKMMGQLRIAEERLNRMQEPLNANITNRAMELQQVVAKKRDELLREVGRQAEARRNTLKETQKKIKRAKSDIETTCEFANNLLAHGSDIEILMHYKAVQERIDELKNKPVVEIPPKMELKFETKSGEVSQLENALGEIEENP